MKKLILLLLGFFSVGCAVNVKMPVNRMISPEAQGEFMKGQIDLRWVGVADIELADNKTSATPDINPDISEDGAIGFGAGVGLFERLDFYYHNSDDSPSHYGLKLQLLGEPRSSSGKGNHSLAIGAAYAYLSETESEEETLGSDTGKAKIKASGYEAFLLYGYRPTEKVIGYLGPFVYEIDAEATVERTSGGSTSVTATPKGEGSQAGVLLGFQFQSEKGYLNFEGGYAKTEYNRTSPSPLDAEDLEDSFFGASVGFMW